MTITINNQCVFFDVADRELVHGHQWRIKRHGYACRETTGAGGKRRTALLHREIIGAVTGQVVDHINGNKLDNRRANLRLVSRGENSTNRKIRKDGTSKWRGVSRHQCGRWQAYIGIGKKPTYLGLFGSEEEAHAAYLLEYSRRVSIVTPNAQMRRDV